MWLDWLSNPGPLAHESGTLPTAPHGPAPGLQKHYFLFTLCFRMRHMLVNYFCFISFIICFLIGFMIFAVLRWVRAMMICTHLFMDKNILT